jgi:hypothetical protein
VWKTMVTGCLTATIMGSARSKGPTSKDNIRRSNAIGTSLPQPSRLEKSGGPSAVTRRAWPLRQTGALGRGPGLSYGRFATKSVSNYEWRHAIVIRKLLGRICVGCLA